MKLNKEIGTALFQFCNEVANNLRSPLNTGDFSYYYKEDNYEKFTSKLQAFKQIIETILEDNKGFKVVDEYFIKEAHLRIFSNVLSSIVMEEPYTEDILNANQITKEALKVLYGVEL